MTLFSIALLVCATPAEPTLTLDTPCVTYAALAKALSVGGREVRCDPAIAERAAALRLNPRPWQAAVSVLGSALDLEVVRRDSELLLREIPSVADRERILFDRYVQQYSAALTGPSRSALAFLGDPPVVDSLLAQRYTKEAERQPTAPRQSGVVASLLLGISACRDVGSSWTDPIVPIWFSGSTLGPLVKGDQIWKGSRQVLSAQLPDWSLWTPADLVGSVAEQLPPSVRFASAERTVQGGFFSYRLTFDPRDGNVRGVRAVTFGSDEAPGLAVELPFHADDWNPEPKLEELVPSKDAAFLDRVRETASFLRAPLASLPIPGPPEGSVARQAWTWAAANKRELAMEIAPLRDSLPREAISGTRSLKSLLEPFASDEQTLRRRILEGLPDTPSTWLSVAPERRARRTVRRMRHRRWSVNNLNGIVHVRNEWHFLDRNYLAPVAPMNSLEEAKHGTEYDLAALIRQGQRLSDRELAALARSDVGTGPGRFWALAPLLRLLSGAIAGDGEKFWRNLAEKQEAEIRFAAMERSAVASFCRTLRAVSNAAFDGDLYDASARSDLDALLFAPNFEATLNTAVIRARLSGNRLQLSVLRPVPSLAFSDERFRERAQTLRSEEVEIGPSLRAGRPEPAEEERVRLSRVPARTPGTTAPPKLSHAKAE